MKKFLFLFIASISFNHHAMAYIHLYTHGSYGCVIVNADGTETHVHDGPCVSAINITIGKNDIKTAISNEMRLYEIREKDSKTK